MQNSKRILIIDQDRMLRETLADFFRDHGREVAVCAEPQSAEKLLKQETFQLIIIDPDFKNNRAAAAILKKASLKNIPLIVYTTGAQQPLRLAPGQELILKPPSDFEYFFRKLLKLSE